MNIKISHSPVKMDNGGPKRK